MGQMYRRMAPGKENPTFRDSQSTTQRCCRLTSEELFTLKHPTNQLTQIWFVLNQASSTSLVFPIYGDRLIFTTVVEVRL